MRNKESIQMPCYRRIFYSLGALVICVYVSHSEGAHAADGMCVPLPELPLLAVSNKMHTYHIISIALEDVTNDSRRLTLTLTSPLPSL